MLQDAQALQRCYSQNFTYSPTAPNTCPVVAGHHGLHRRILFHQGRIPDATDYKITATPLKSPQTGDTDCASFTLLSSGQQSAQNSGGTDSTSTCWGR